MTSPKERLISAMEMTNTGRPPCICPGGMMNMVTKDIIEISGEKMPEAHFSGKSMAKLAKAVYENGMFENYGVPFCMTAEAEDFGAEVDMGTDIFEPHVIKYVIESCSHYKLLKPINLEAGRSKAILDAIRILKEGNDSVPVIGNVTGPVSTASSVMEPVIFYKELRKKKEDAHFYLKFVTDELIRFSLAQIEAGADIISISDPSGTGEILGPKMFKEFVVDYLNQIVDAVHEKGVKCIVHICGQMKTVLKEFAEVRADLLSFDSMVSIRLAKEIIGDRAIMGNVSTYTLEYGDEETVKKLTKNCLKNGSDVLAPACGIGMRSPIKNVRAILEALKEEENV